MPTSIARRLAVALGFSLLSPALLVAQDAAAKRAAECPDCATWNAPHKPFRVFGNTYYVGTHGLAAILVASPSGHALLDGGLPESAPQIAANIRALGFRLEDVKLIVNSHAHFDHAGGIAELQRASGAEVAASPWSASVLRRGTSGEDDPQFGVLLPYAPVAKVRTIADRETLRAGTSSLTAHFTGGHTPGGTSWAWRSCEDAKCLDFIYADSQTPVSADGFSFSKSKAYPNAVSDFERGFLMLERVSCDVIMTPHPGASSFWERIAARDRGDVGPLTGSGGCRAYAATTRRRLAERLAKER